MISNEATETESDFNYFQARQSQKSWNNLVVASVAKAAEVDPFNSLPVGSVIPAVDALNWSGQGDIRPRLWDKAAKVFRLIDSGSMISATTRSPEDTEDNSLKLIAVNGSPIKTYGVKNLQVKIGRKQYEIPAIVCDISQDILGADFINKYKLSLMWDDLD